MTTYAAAFERIGIHLWSVSWEVSILILVIAVVERLFRWHSPWFRYFLWMVVVVRLIVPIPISLPDSVMMRLVRIPGIEKPVRQFMEWSPLLNEPIVLRNLSPEIPNTIENQETTLAADANEQAPDRSARIEATLSPLGYTGLLWCAAVITLALLIAIRWLNILHSLNKYTSIKRNDLQQAVETLSQKLGLRRRVLLCKWDKSVALIGVFRPRIFLPETMIDNWPIQEIEPILLHELAHVKRADVMLNWLQMILQVVYFFHPLVWFANRRIRNVREEACDDLALSALNGSRKHYATSLLRVLEESSRLSVLRFAAMGFSERRSTLGERIRRIMSQTDLTVQLTRKSVFSLASIATIVILLTSGVSSLWHSGFPEAALRENSILPEKTETREEPIVIDIIDDSTFHIFGEDVAQARMEQVLREKIKPDSVYLLILQGESGIPIDVIVYFREIADRLGIDKVGINNNIPQEYGKMIESIQNMIVIYSETIIVKLHDNTTYQVEGQMIPRNDLEQVLKNKVIPNFSNSILLAIDMHPENIAPDSAQQFYEACSFLMRTAQNAGYDRRIYAAGEYDQGVFRPYPREKIVVKMLNNNTFLVLGNLISRADLEQALIKMQISEWSGISMTMDDPEKISLGAQSFLSTTWGTVTRRRRTSSEEKQQ
ncbi:M56 family metallopeptidase [Candidatus Latescibacterota bacterium]